MKGIARCDYRAFFAVVMLAALTRNKESLDKGSLGQRRKKEGLNRMSGQAGAQHAASLHGASNEI